MICHIDILIFVEIYITCSFPHSQMKIGMPYFWRHYCSYGTHVWFMGRKQLGIYSCITLMYQVWLPSNLGGCRALSSHNHLNFPKRVGNVQMEIWVDILKSYNVNPTAGCGWESICWKDFISFFLPLLLVGNFFSSFAPQYSAHDLDL